MLEYRTVPAIINNSLSKRTMKVVHSRFLVMSESTRWTMVFKVRYMYKRIKILTSWGQRWWSFWESSTSAIVKAVHPSMAGSDAQKEQCSAIISAQ